MARTDRTAIERQRRYRARLRQQGITPFTVRLPVDTVDHLKAAAARQGCTVSELLVRLARNAP